MHTQGKHANFTQNIPGPPRLGITPKTFLIAIMLVAPPGDITTNLFAMS